MAERFFNFFNAPCGETRAARRQVVNRRAHVHGRQEQAGLDVFRSVTRSPGRFASGMTQCPGGGAL